VDRLHRESDNAMSTTVAKPKHPLINGKPIRFRFFQQYVVWLVIVAVLGSALVAGGYFNLLEVNWHLFYLKHWWDGGMGVFHSASWFLYRHGYRNDGEPAVAIMLISSFIASPKYWGRRVGRIRLVVTPFVLVIVAVALITGAIWLQYFGLPNMWHAILGSDRVHLFHPKYWAIAETLIFGFLIGRVLHPIWGPVGAHIQGFYVNRSLMRHQGGSLPLWVR
jgi:hypothetical protein